MANIFTGQRILVVIEFRLLGAPTDPVVVRALARKPDGSQIVLSYPDDDFTRRDLGIYEAYFEVDDAGTWHFRGEGAGTVDAVNEISVEVLQSAFTV